jgi:two-component system cell cycle response regulator
VEHRPVVEQSLDKAGLAVRGPVDLVIVNAAARDFDGLRFAAGLRSDEATRNLPILAIYDPDDRGRAVKALELGINDLLAKPIDPQELAARARTQIKRKRYTDLLRNNLDNSLELAVTDPLTGLPAQPPLHDRPARSAGPAGGQGRSAGRLPAARHRPLQEDQR